jgi:hypothetical protein
MSIKHLSVIFVFVLGISFAGHDALGLMKKKGGKRTVYEVPTTGKIINVEYHPEFDEWWVHCREGNNVVVYTYDYRNKTWAKVTFTPKKTEEQPQKTGNPVKTKTTGQAGTATIEEEQKTQHPKIAPIQKGHERRWWDPLKLLPKR